MFPSSAVWCCTSRGAYIINFSLGDPKKLNRLSESYSDRILLVAAAGNDGYTSLVYPASFKGVISVGAVDENIQVARFSNRNHAVDLVAPCCKVLSTIAICHEKTESNEARWEYSDKNLFRSISIFVWYCC